MNNHFTDFSPDKILDSLTASKGGSLVKRVKKRQLDPDVSVLFVGLGGLGCKTVNDIKAEYINSFEPSTKIRFLAVDSAYTDLQNCLGGSRNSNSAGTLSQNETFCIYSSEAVKGIVNPPAEVQAWLGNVNTFLPPQHSSNGVRQFGRAMLCGTPVYGKLKKYISEILWDPTFFTPVPGNENVRLNVVVISGVSGGTGSGIIVDVSYMIRRLLQDIYDNHEGYTELWGVLYTPEVQFGEPFAESPNNAEYLRKNGYAALKEIDYYMNAPVSEDPIHPLYEMRIPYEGDVSCNKNIFMPCHAFLVSPNSSVTGCRSILSTTAKALLALYEKTSTRAPSYDFSRATDFYANNWRKEHVGKDPATMRPVADPCGNIGARFPAFMPYGFSAIGYGSLYVPKDELLAYCANQAFLSIYQRWHNIDAITQQYIDCSLTNVGLGSVEMICKILQEKLTNGNAAELFKTDDIKYVRVLGLGRYDQSSFDRAMEQAKSRVDGILAGAMVPTARKKYAEELTDTLISSLESENFVTQYGPFVGLVLLNGVHSENLQGAIQRLDAMINQLAHAVPNDPANPLTKATEEFLKAQKSLEDLAAERKADKAPTDDEVNEFRNKCLEYSMAYFKLRLYDSLLVVRGNPNDGILSLMRSRLSAYNNETFEIYTTVLEAFSEVLQKDAAVIGEAERSYLKTGEVFGFDALGIADAESKKDRFEALFDGYIDADKVEGITDAFAKSMFDPNHRKIWANFVNDPDALSDEIRAVFKGFFQPMVSDLLQKLLVFSHIDPNEIDNCDFIRLNQIWNARTPETEEVKGDHEIRKYLIYKAGAAIGHALKEQSKPLLKYQDNNLLYGPYKMAYLQLYRFEETEADINTLCELNAAIVQNLGLGIDVGTVAFVPNDAKPVMVNVSCVFPVSLSLLKGLDSSFAAYRKIKSINDTLTSAGTHLYENSDWALYLPEPYGADTYDYYTARMTPSIKDSEDLDRTMLNLIAKRIQICSENGLLRVQNDHYGSFEKYILISDIRSKDDFAAFKAEYLVCRNVFDALHAVNARDAEAISYREISLIPGPNHCIKVDALPVDPFDFSNLCRVIRSSVIYQMKLKETADFCMNLPSEQTE